MVKPPYRVPSMAEIAAVAGSNGYRAVSTFSGCGGSSLGYEMAGFRLLWASEFVPAARQTYVLNHPKVAVDARDIREVAAADVLEATGLGVGELDLLDGSPPCASFSTAGKRSKGWGTSKKYSDVEQRTDDLFLEYVRLIDGLRPKVFVAENVSGLVKGVAKGWFLEILARMKACGYRVEARVLDAQWLGVPQQRQRLIFVGVREDLGVAPRHPTPLTHRYSVREAIWDLARAGGYENEDIRRFAIGPEAEKLREGGHSDRYISLQKCSNDAPAFTITARGGYAGVAGPVHPEGWRKFTIDELKRICGFPDDFRLTGSYGQQWERLGRAVPPVMMATVAGCARDMLDEAKNRR